MQRQAVPAAGGPGPSAAAGEVYEEKQKSFAICSEMKQQRQRQRWQRLAVSAVRRPTCGYAGPRMVGQSGPLELDSSCTLHGDSVSIGKARMFRITCWLAIERKRWELRVQRYFGLALVRVILSLPGSSISGTEPPRSSPSRYPGHEVRAAANWLIPCLHSSSSSAVRPFAHRVLGWLCSGVVYSQVQRRNDQTFIVSSSRDAGSSQEL
ncbi:hypothetical protein TgHK011_000575 [Trichoderma gracile]|nr:hypothetical protein TgHK011_000575 [Trichoderma gracile]